MIAKTIEDEVRELKQAEIQAFKMPKPCRGQAVTWYADANRRLPEVAFALEVGLRNIVVQRASGVCVECVYHIDDPKLQISADMRESGGWDFTDQDKQAARQANLIEQLTARVKALEDLLNEPAKKGDKK